MTQYRKALTAIERNLLLYLSGRERSQPGEPCLIPRRINASRAEYTRAINYLEAKGFIAVERPNEHYRTWRARLLAVPAAP